jgi:hypothetical protein
MQGCDDSTRKSEASERGVVDTTIDLPVRVIADCEKDKTSGIAVRRKFDRRHPRQILSILKLEFWFLVVGDSPTHLIGTFKGPVSIANLFAMRKSTQSRR